MILSLIFYLSFSWYSSYLYKDIECMNSLHTSILLHTYSRFLFFDILFFCIFLFLPRFIGYKNGMEGGEKGFVTWIKLRIVTFGSLHWKKKVRHRTQKRYFGRKKSFVHSTEPKKGFEFVSILRNILGSVRTTRKNSKKCPESITNNFRQLKFGAKSLEGFVLSTKTVS